MSASNDEIGIFCVIKAEIIANGQAVSITSSYNDACRNARGLAVDHPGTKYAVMRADTVFQADQPVARIVEQHGQPQA